MKNSNSGFTLIEMLVVIAIVGILAAVALPIYRGYTIMAKLSEVFNAMSTVSSGVTSYYRDEGAWPSCPTINEVRNSLGVSLSALTRISAMSIANADGKITATVNNIDAIVDNKTLTLTPSTSGIDGSIFWSWGWSANFPAQFRPKS